MTPGPDRIISCPLCGALARHFTLYSGNTLGQTVWSDGKRIAPMLPQPPPFIRCPGCKGFYWLHQAAEVGKLTMWDDEQVQSHPAWAAAPEVEEPAEEEYYFAIDAGLGKDLIEQRYLRIGAWWRRNDASRLSGVFANTVPGGSENMEALVTMLDETDPNDRLMKAELLRQLGNFEHATQLLASGIPEGYEAPAEQLLGFCGHGDTIVRELDV